MNLMKRVLSLVLALILLLGNIPAAAFATETTATEAATEPAAETESPTQPDTVPEETAAPTEAPTEAATEPTAAAEEIAETTAPTAAVTEPAAETEAPTDAANEPELVHEHEYASVTTAPTCTEQGYTTYTCDCGDSYVSDYVDATGHTYENGLCTGCGEKQLLASVPYLSYEDAVVQLREEMVARTEEIVIRVASETELTTNDMSTMWQEAMAHTGNPKEGDYIRTHCGKVSYAIETSGSDGAYQHICTFTPVWYTTAEQENEMDALVADILAELNLSEGTEYERLTGAYNWVTENIVYDFENLDDDDDKLKYTAYGAVTRKKAVCQGFAALYYRLALELGIDCRYISGDGDGENHGWNIVLLDGKYYNVDPTWDRSLMGHYRYFLRSEAAFGDHTRNSEYDTADFHARYPMAEVSYTPTAAASGTVNSNIEWILDGETGTLSVTGTGAIPSYRFSQAPWYSYRESVKSIVVSEGITEVGERAFYWCVNCTSVTLPSTLIAIREYGFNNLRALTGINLPENLKILEFCAFSECVALKTISLPDSVTTVESNCFSNCPKLQRAYLSDGMTTIPDSMFGGCTYLREVTLPKNLVSIGDTAFINSGLWDITIPATVTEIGTATFSGCTSLTKFVVAEGNTTFSTIDGVLYSADQKTLLCYPAGSSRYTYSIPEGTEKIAYGAFRSAFYMGKLVFPSTLKTIDDYAFSYCSNLSQLTFPTNITYIGDSAFRACKRLTSVTFQNPSVTLDDAVFADCDSLVSIALPAKLQVIENSMFFDCAKLQNVTIPSTVKRIESSAFCACDGLVSITIPGNVTYLGTQVLDYCNSLEEVILEEGVQKLDRYCIRNAPKLKSVTIPDSLTSIGTENFDDCPGVTLKVNCNSYGHTYAVSKGISYTASHPGTVYNTVQPTCTAQGYTQVSCKCGLSGYRTNYTSAYGHDYVGTVTAPTCLTDGYTTFVCTRCDETFEDNWISAPGHDIVVEGRAEATCTEDGYSGDEICQTCGETVTEGQIIPSPGHQYEFVVTAPTCIEQGYTTYTCRCGDTYVSDEVAALGHTEVIDKAVAATCTATGLTEGKRCSVCEEILVAQTVVAALGHTEVIDKAVAATCTATGLTEGKHCSVCEEILVAQKTVAALGHTEVIDKAIAATCTETGLTEGKHCSVCEEILVAQKTVAALGHTEVIDKAVAATCTATGLTEGKHCSVCEEILVAQKTVAALGHTEVIDKAVAATCTATGLTEGKHCSVCNEILVAQKTVAATGHAWDDGVVTKEATEETEGEKLFTCTNCGETKTQTIPTLDHVHSYSSVVTAPTCTEAGYTTYTCRCGDSYVDDYVDARGYDWMLEDGAFNLLLIGNSFSEDASSCGCGMTTSQLLDILQAMLGDNVEITIGLCYSGGKGLNWHATQSEQGNANHSLRVITSETGKWKSHGSITTADALSWADWDVVSLQHYEINTATGEEGNAYPEQVDSKFLKLEAAAEFMLDYVDQYAPDAATYFYMHWSRAYNSKLNESLAKYQQMAAFFPEVMEYRGTENGNRFDAIIPVGLSVQNARTTYLAKLAYNTTAYADGNLNLTTDAQIGLQRDGGHLSFNVGRYIAGLTFAETIIPNELRAEGYVLPEIRVTESVGKLPLEYTVLAQKSVFAAMVSMAQGTLGVTDIAGYTEDPTVAEAARLADSELNVSCAVDAEMLKTRIMDAMTAAVSEDFVVDAVALPEDFALSEDTRSVMATVTIRFGYTSVQVDVTAVIGSHDYQSNITVPTCTEQGFTTHVCTTCGDTYVSDEVAALGHTEVIDKAVAATCTATGLTEGKHCSVCDETLVAQTVVAALGHTEVIDKAVAATCTATGLTEGKHCSVCDEILVAQTTTDELGHYHATADVLADGEELVLTAFNVVKHDKSMIFSAEVENLGEGLIRLSHGEKSYTGSHLEITASKLVVYNTSSAVSSKEYAHGLNIEGRIKVRVDVIRSGAEVTITTNSGTFTKSVSWSGCNGEIACCAEGAKLNNVDFRWFARGIESDYWFFGDSWFSTSSSARWTKYLLDDGYDVLLGGYGGMGAPAGLKQFKELLSVAVPEYAIWCLGMNNGDRDGKINASWLSATEEFLALCEQYGITPILSTVPTTPKVNNRLKNAWIMESGYRYIDFDLAIVENHITGEWFESTAASDLNHPTTEGAKLLYPQVFIDFPELAKADPENCTHSLYKLRARAAECEYVGRGEYYICTLCAETFADPEAKEAVETKDMLSTALGHDMGDWVITTPATCTEAGEQRRDCSRCDHFETEAIAATGHTEVINEAVAATCTTTGLTEGKHCSVCDEILVAQTVVAALGHTEVIDKAIAATCTATGLTEGKHCSVCDEILVAQKVVAATGHAWDDGVVTKEATEETEGEKLFTCTNCGETKTQTIPTLDHVHSYSSVVTAPTCTEQGYTTYTCRCGDTYVSDEVAALGHTEVIDKAVAATCTTTGLTEGKHCSVCKEVLVKQKTVAALGHTEVIDKAVAATCTATGLTEGKHCSVCEEILIAQTVVEALGHTEVIDEAVAATCTATGLTEGKHCSVCDEILVAQKTVAALGHTEVIDKAVAATCTATGLTEGKHCSVCDEILVAQEVVAATGHTFGDWEQTEEAGEERRECAACGYCETREVEAQPLEAPVAKISGDAETGKPIIKWNTVEGAVKYRVYRSTKKTSGYKLVCTAKKGRSYTDMDAVAGTNYYYKVKAVHEDSTLNSDWSNVVNRMCDLPQPEVSITGSSASGKPIVKWETVKGASKYRVYRATSKNGDYELIYTGVKARSYTDKTAKAGKTYYYKVKAVHSKSAADSALSDAVSRLCELAKPVVSITRKNGDPRLTWDKVDGAAKYYIYRANSKSGEYVRIKTTVSATSFTDTTAKAGKTYYYKVKAIHSNTDANSAYSSIKYITAK